MQNHGMVHLYPLMEEFFIDELNSYLSSDAHVITNLQISAIC